MVLADGLRRTAHGGALLAELAARYPVAGSVYNWSKRLGNVHVGWLAGWMMLVASIVSLAAVALAYQLTLPQIPGRTPQTVTLVNGVASGTFNPLQKGTHTVTANYNGDVNYAASAGSTTQQVTN